MLLNPIWFCPITLLHYMQLSQVLLTLSAICTVKFITYFRIESAMVFSGDLQFCTKEIMYFFNMKEAYRFLILEQ